jgi:hypothetical protein
MLPIVEAIIRRIALAQASFRAKPLKYDAHSRLVGPYVPGWQRAGNFGTVERSGSSQVPLFGASEGFGMDWVQTKSIPVPAQGYREEVAPPTVNNSQGRVKNWKPNPDLPAPYVDPALSHTGRKTGQGTDQRPTVSRRSSGASWDGVVRAYQGAPKGFEGVRRKSEPTWGDVHAEELKREPYSFF